MMPEDFEKQLQEQGTGFSVQPREDVWGRIASELDKKKKRRLAAWWWFPIGLTATLLPLALYFYPAGKEKGAHKPGTEKSAVFSRGGKKEKNAPEREQMTGTEHMADASAARNAGSIEKVAPGNTKRNSGMGLNNGRAPHSRTPFNPRAPLYSQTIPLTRPADTALLLMPEFHHREDKAAYSFSNLSIPSETTPREANAAAPSAGLIPRKLHSTPELPGQAPAYMIIQRNKIKAQPGWELKLGGGSSYMSTGTRPLFPLFPLFNQRPSSDYYASPGNGSQTGGGVQYRMYAPRPALSLSAMLYRRHPLSYRWTFSAGAGVQYMGYSQPTGNRKDSSLTTPYLNNTNRSVNHFYASGNTSTYRGYFARLLVSGDISYRLPALKERLSLRTGIGIGYNFAARFLVPDNQQGRYLSFTSERAQVNLNVSGGMSYHTRDQYTFSFEYISDLNKAYTPISGYAPHWKQWQVSAGIPIRP